MPIGSKLVILLCLCLSLRYPTTEANPAENRVARSSNDLYDWLTSLFDYEDSEEILLCRNCTVVVSQDHRNGTDTTAAPATEAPTPAPAPAPTPAPTAAPPSGNDGAPNVAPTAATAAPPPPPTVDPAAVTPPAAPAEGQ
ncbi:formin-1-like [Drosophila innubila]|uniref:formin-1-like n=1 Tax=Drosophila innubila TaxID=198719 RepID=UPI00148BFCF0|nr:formin-1-like [Drosophila innubila]